MTALSVKKAKPGRHRDGGGLYLLVKPTGSKSWLLRVQSEGRRRDIGLGSAVTETRLDRDEPIDIPLLLRRELTLAEARDKATLLRRAAHAGMDPVVERDRERKKTPTFREATVATHAALKDGWIAKNAAAFLTSLESYAYPALAELRVDTIEVPQIRDMLAPIWTAKPELSRKVRMRVGQVLNFSHSKGWRASGAPGRAITVGLPKQPAGKNFKAMPYEAVPRFVADLQGKASTAGRNALLFQMLTAARPGEVRAAKWEQINLDRCEWVRPAAIMKSGEAHTVTLSTAAVELLKRVRGEREPKGDEHVFLGQRGGMISDMTMNKVLRDASLPYDAHAFRSSFRDWAAEKMPQIPDPVAEPALAHVVPDKVVRAYKRTSFIQMRRELLEAWGTFVVGL